MLLLSPVKRARERCESWGEQEKRQMHEGIGSKKWANDEEQDRAEL